MSGSRTGNTSVPIRQNTSCNGAYHRSLLRVFTEESRNVLATVTSLQEVCALYPAGSYGIYGEAELRYSGVCPAVRDQLQHVSYRFSEAERFRQGVQGRRLQVSQRR